MSILLQTVEKGQDKRSIPCADFYRGRFGLQLLVRVLKEQPKSIAVAGDGLWAAMFVLNQMFGKEPLQQGAGPAPIRWTVLR